MDFHSMNRKELQALCKQHKIPANLSNLEMAKRLAECFEEIENSANQGLTNGQGENACEAESANVVSDKKVKKVRFSPVHELIEFTRSPGILGRTRRNSVSVRASVSSDGNAENVDRRGRFTRSRGATLIEEDTVEKKRGRKGEQGKKENQDNGGLGDGCVGATVRILRSRGKTIAEGINDAKGNGNALNSVDDGKSVEEIVDRTVRVTRSRCQKLTEGTLTETKRVRKLVEIVGDVPSVSGEADAKRAATRRSSRKGVEINGKQQEVLEGEADAKRVATRRLSGKGVEISGKEQEVLEFESDAKRMATRLSARKGVEINGKQEEVLEGEVDAKKVATRRSSGKGVEISGKQQEVLGGESDIKRVATRLSSRKGVEINGKRREEVLEKTEKIEVNRTIAPRVLVRSSKRNATTAGNSERISKGSRKSEILSTTDVNAENGISKGKCDGSVLPTNQPEVRRSNMSKDLVAVHEKGRNVELKEETENTRQLRSSAPQSVISGRVPKNQKKMPQLPIEIMRPSRRKTLIPGNCEAEKHFSKEFPVEKGPSAVLNNTRRSRRVASMCKPVQVPDERGGDSIAQQMNAARKPEIGPISEEVVMVDNDLGSLKQSGEESINDKAISISEFQLSLSDGAVSSNNPGLSSDTKNKSSTRKTHREEQVVSIADSSKSTEMDFVGSNVLANTANMEKDIPASNIKDEGNVDSSEFDVQDIIEQDIINMVKNQFEVHLCCQIKGSNCVNTTDDQIFHEDTNVSGIEGFAETISSVNFDLEVMEAEADTHTQAGSIVVEGVSVLDNPDLAEAGQANVISLTNACHQNNIDPMEASNRISDDKKEDRALEAQEVDASESCEKGNEGALQLMDPSSAMVRSIGLVETYTQKGIVPEFEDIERGDSLKDKKTVSNEDDEFSMPGLFGGEKSVGMAPEDRGVMSVEYSTMNSGEKVMDRESLAVIPIISSPNITDSFLERDLETEHTGQGEGHYIDKNAHYDVAEIDAHYDVAEIDEGGSPDCHGDGVGEFVMSNTHKITSQDTEIISDENFIKQQRVKGDETSTRKDYQLESAENNEGVCSKNHKGTNDVEVGFSVINLFDCEGSNKITPQVSGVFSPQDLSKGFDDFHVLSTMYKEVMIGASSLKEISPSEPNTSHKSQGDGPIISDDCEFIDNEAVPVAISDEAPQTFNLADDHTIECTHTQVKQHNSPSAMPTAIEGQDACNDVSKTSAIEGQEACDDVRETTRSAMCISQTYGKGITSPVLDESNTNEDDGKDKYESPDEFMRDAGISMDCSIGKLGDERFCGLELHYTGLTGVELNNLSETTMNDGGTPNGLNSLTNMKDGEVEREITTTHKNAVLPTNYKEVSGSNVTSGVDREDNQLKLLVATQPKVGSPSKVDEISSHEEKSDIADVSTAECVDTIMENSAAQITSDEKVLVAENELNEVESVELVSASTVVLCEALAVNMTENTYDECLERSDLITEEIRDEKVITLGEATENDSGLGDGYTISSANSDDPESCQDKINTDLSENLDFENRVSPKSEIKTAPSSVAEFELPDADIQKSNKLENSHHPTACYEDNNLSKMLIDTLKESPMDTEGANIGCGVNDEKYVENKGTSPGLFPKASNDCDEVTVPKYETENDDDEAKTWDEKDDDSRSIADIFDESKCTSEDPLSVTEGFDVFSNLAMHIFAEEKETDDTRKSGAGTPVPNSVGDHEKNSKEGEINAISISELYLEQEVVDSGNDASDETGDIKKADSRTPLFNLEYGDREKNDTEVEEEKSAATIVQFPISELHLEEEILESNNDVPAAAFGCKEFLKESDVDDTIKEYINSELARMNEMAPSEDGLQSVESIGTECKHPEEATCVDNVHVGGEEQTEEMLYKESLRGPDAASVDLVGDSGSGGNDALLLQKEEIESKEDGYVISTSGDLCLAAKKNARTILIHGTPGKAMAIADMKENAPTLKSANVGDFTALRPAKRKALQDVQWK